MFFFSNLLLAPHLPPAPNWLKTLLLAESDGFTALYFSAIIGATALAAGILVLASRNSSAAAGTQFLQALLGFLVSVQFLLIPINYGILVIDKSLPRVTALGENRPLRENERAWLAWEGNRGITYLVREQKSSGEQRTLITLPQIDPEQNRIDKVQISGYDRILRVLFTQQEDSPSPVPANTNNKDKRP